VSGTSTSSETTALCGARSAGWRGVLSIVVSSSSVAR
jgi:hypothetical protein